jgi:hypothetical protein
VPSRAELPSEKKTLGDAEEVMRVCAELEVELQELKAQYDQYFLGMERLPPTKHHQRLKKRVLELKNTFVRQTVTKFRVAQLAQKLTTYERLWDRSIKEIEAGTYSRDVFKARRHLKEREKKKKKGDGEEDFHIDEDLDLSDLGEEDSLEDALAAASAAVAKPVTPAVKPVTGVAPVVKPVTGERPVMAAPPTPAPAPKLGPDGKPVMPKISAPITTGTTPALKPATTGSTPALKPATPGGPPRPATTGSTPALKPGGAPKPAPVAADGGLSDQKIKAIYDAYVMAKKRCGEDTRSVTLDSVSATLKKQVPELMKQHQAKSVEFKVVIKDGKAVLRALPKE